MGLLNIFSSKQIKTAAIGSLVIKFLSALFALFNGILLANLLTVKDFGIYVLAFTTITVISIPVSLGLPNLITRYISKYEITNDVSSIKGLLIRSNQLVVITSLLAIIVAFISYAVWWKSYPMNVVSTFWYSFLLLPLLVFGSLRASALRGLKFIILGQLPDTFLRNLFLTFFLLLAILFDFKIEPQIAMILHAFAAAIAFLIGYFILKNKLLNRLKGETPTYKNKLWLKEAVPFSITSGVQVIKSKLLIYVLAIFGSIEAVAIYDIAMRGASLVAFTLDALNSAISPYISSAFELNQKVSLQRIITKSTRLIFILSLPIALFFIVGGETIISLLFGDKYTIAYIPLAILCVGQLVNSFTGSVGIVLNMTGNQKYLSKNQVQMMLISAILSIPFVIYYDVIGAALVYSFVLILQNIILVVYVKNTLNINTTVF
ncbi:MAG: oligosaccharide flippase family protein [Bacteroidetes bacterium]|nr:oligosaccharide flippase family protein [Bacteroidota bacterium]